MRLQWGACVLWGLRDAGPHSILWGWELDFAFPPGDGGQALASPQETCAHRQPQWCSICCGDTQPWGLQETSLMGTDSIGHRASGPGPAPQLCLGSVSSLNPNIILAKPLRNKAFLLQTTRMDSAAGGAMLSQHLWTQHRGEFEAK